MMPEDTGERVKPQISVVESQEGVISYPQSRITEPLGTSPGSLMEAAAQFASQVDPAAYKACLLYTSPSPRDAHESRMPSSA